MERGVKISIAATIVLAGVTLAMLSRRDAIDAARPAMAPGEQLTFRDQVPLREMGLPRVVEPRPAPPVRPAATVSASRETPQPAANAGPPSDARSAHHPTWRALRHRIVDGDTLALLAQRYLGSADRQGEIFEANRGVLSNPDLLPIGAVLKIPAPESAGP
jgi:nucleoid-associated protein YgaU